MIRRFFQRIINGVRYDYIMACGLKGYLVNRLKEKTTWGSILAAIAAANELKPAYAAATIVISTVVALLPSPSKM